MKSKCIKTNPVGLERISVGQKYIVHQGFARNLRFITGYVEGDFFYMNGSKIGYYVRTKTQEQQEAILAYQRERIAMRRSQQEGD